MKQITIAPQLEQSLLKAIGDGLVAPTLLNPNEISKEGRTVLKSINHLFKHGAKPPLKSSSILFIAVKIFGSHKRDTRRYIRLVSHVDTDIDAKVIIKSARSKEALVNLINEAGAQLSDGVLDRKRLARMVDKEQWSGETLRPLSSRIDHGFPKPPSGPSIPSLPYISKVARGLCGIWVIGAEPGLGKSTLVWQIGLDTNSSEFKVLYYDLDATGEEWLIDNTRRIVDDSKKEFKRLTEYLYYRDSIRNFESDLAAIKPPALIIVDMVQSLPVDIVHRRSSIDKWLLEFKDISKRGYSFICVSEISRNSYGRPGLDGYKETGELEYAGSFCPRLLSEDEDDENAPIEFHVGKNRHSKRKGHIINLERDKKKVFWFNEVEVEED